MAKPLMAEVYREDKGSTNCHHIETAVFSTRKRAMRWVAYTIRCDDEERGSLSDCLMVDGQGEKIAEDTAEYLKQVEKHLDYAWYVYETEVDPDKDEVNYANDS